MNMQVAHLATAILARTSWMPSCRVELTAASPNYEHVMKCVAAGSLMHGARDILGRFSADPKASARHRHRFERGQS